MNVSELFELTHWVTKEIGEAQIPQKYQALQTIIQQHAQPNQQRQPFEAQKDDLIEALRNIPLSQELKSNVVSERLLTRRPGPCFFLRCHP